LAGVFHRGEHGTLRDLVEAHAAERLVFRGRRERLHQVPGDRLPFPVGVGGEVDRAGLLRRTLQLRQRLLLAAEGLIRGLVRVVAIHAQTLLRKVAEVAVGSEQTEVLPEKLLEGPRLRRRLDDHDVRHDRVRDGATTARKEQSRLRVPLTTTTAYSRDR